jgi:hypothetical protein
VGSGGGQWQRVRGTSWQGVRVGSKVRMGSSTEPNKPALQTNPESKKPKTSGTYDPWATVVAMTRRQHGSWYRIHGSPTMMTRAWARVRATLNFLGSPSCLVEREAGKAGVHRTSKTKTNEWHNGTR